VKIFLLGLLVSFSLSASVLAHDDCEERFEQNCVEGRVCAELKNGTCYVWNTTKACGRYCATGKTCAHSQNNTCFVWDTIVACGRNACTVNRTCGALKNGTCFFYNESVNCN
jgi:hypothetical protein